MDNSAPDDVQMLPGVEVPRLTDWVQEPRLALLKQDLDSCKSNMSKFISSEEDKIKALAYYYELGFQPDDLYLHGSYPTMCIKVRRDIRLNGKFYPEGKFLKNMVTFKEPDFSNLLP